MIDYQVINYMPTAKISFEQDPWFKEGTYKLKLEASEPLLEIPSLSYKLEGKEPVAVQLEGMGKFFYGEIEITKQTGEDLAEFSFI